jgi:Ca-activated chloride channel family protein
MLAEQPSRQERARRALLDLADALEKRGGHRIGLVVFAARAKLVCPLTHDYDHFRDALKQQDASLLPEDLSPAGAGAASGTRIGAGLREAVAAHDPRFTGYQDILLVSDGDDPATDREWSEGAEAAHSRRIPVYTVGVGDPDTRGEIWVAGVPLKHNGAAVRTKLEEGPLLEIARRTGGTYLPVRTHTLPPGRLLREVLEARAVRDYDEAALPVLKPRYPWFFGAALAFFALSIVIADRRRPRPEKAVSEDSPATVTTVVVPAATVRKVTAAATELLNQNQP